MRVAFAGASGTGKSTLAAFVAAEYGLPINPVSSRSVAKEMGFVDPVTGDGRPYDVDRAAALAYEDALARANVGAAAQRAIDVWNAEMRYDGRALPSVRPLFQRRLAEAKIAWETGPDAAGGFVTDRTPLDDLTYAVMHCPEVVDEAFIRRASTHTETYDVVFYCPLYAGQWLKDDPARVVDPAYHWRYDTFILGLLTKFRINPTVIEDQHAGVREDVVGEVLDVVTDAIARESR